MLKIWSRVALISMICTVVLVGCTESGDVELKPNPESGEGSTGDEDEEEGKDPNPNPTPDPGDKEEVDKEGFTELNRVLEYRPAPGQFVKASDWDDCERAYKCLKEKDFLSLGAWGGFVSVGFSGKVVNGEGADIAIQGNPFATSNEPGIVWVSVDSNSNGKCDDVWYELKGSEFGKATTVQNYRKQYEGVDHTFEGTKLASNATETATDYWTLAPLEWGYADNLSAVDYKNYYNVFDISNAVDATGAAVTLKNIDFVRVQSGVDATAGKLGEVSTEVLHIKAKLE